jgi:hypothetical protein
MSRPNAHGSDDVINLKYEVTRAVRREWRAFAAEHPRLAAVLDETVVADAAARCIADDPEYREAMATAAAVGAGAAVVSDVVARLVARWLRALA